MNLPKAALGAEGSLPFAFYHILVYFEKDFYTTVIITFNLKKKKRLIKGHWLQQIPTQMDTDTLPGFACPAAPLGRS